LSAEDRLIRAAVQDNWQFISRRASAVGVRSNNKNFVAQGDFVTGAKFSAAPSFDFVVDEDFSILNQQFCLTASVHAASFQKVVEADGWFFVADHIIRP
jgi:hypothetical protein